MEPRICEKCGDIMYYNPYFKKMECTGCGHMGTYNNGTTVKDLRKAIRHLPDDTFVTIFSEGKTIPITKIIPSRAGVLLFPKGEIK